MGRFSTTIQIKNNTHRVGFINSFCEVMKKRGFTPCVEDEAALSYALAFSEGGWVTLVNEDYRDNPKKAQDDLKYLADGLKTSAFSVEVVDSDFAILTLDSGDTVIVGDGSGYGIEDPSRGNRKYWEPIFANGRTWEQFSDIVEKSSTFVEDTLSELAVILGISSELICADNSELSYNGNVVQLYFKKTEAKAKPMTLKAGFKKVFGEALEPLGFKLIKSKYPYFVRVVPGGEIIHIITYAEMWCPYHGRKEFDILSGIATVYRYKIDLNLPSKINANWLRSISKFYSRTTPESEYDDEYRKSIFSFQVEEDSESSLYNALNYTLELTKKYILPQLNTAVDLKSSLIYLKRLRQSTDTCNFDSELNFAGAGNAAEGFLYVKTDDEEFKTLLKNIIDGTVPSGEEGRQIAAEKLKFINDPVIHEKVLLELERRKAENTEILKSYGLSL